MTSKTDKKQDPNLGTAVSLPC